VRSEVFLVFIGHYAVAFGTKKFVPSISLGALFLACQLADLIWPSLVLLGIERLEIDPGNTAITPMNFVHYPYSHSLLAMTAFGCVLAIVYWKVFHVNAKMAAIIVLLVLSHWVLDALTHRPDLPLTLSGSARIGLGLWNLPTVSVGIEVLLYGAGVWLYSKCTRPLDRIGSIGFWGLAGFLLLVYIANVAASLAGPPPPSVATVAWSAQAMWLIVIWGFWIDRHRGSAGEKTAQVLAK
jgi:membrane-bound metal-dependent hydrolase YbcI (DUF457 family)